MSNLEGGRTPTWKVVELDAKGRLTGEAGRVASNRGVEADPVVHPNLESCRTPGWNVVELAVEGGAWEMVGGVGSNRGVKEDPSVTVAGKKTRETSTRTWRRVRSR